MQPNFLINYCVLKELMRQHEYKNILNLHWKPQNSRSTNIVNIDNCV